MTETRDHSLEVIAPPNNQACTYPAESATGFCLARATHVNKFEELSDGDWKLNSVLLCAGHAGKIAVANRMSLGGDMIINNTTVSDENCVCIEKIKCPYP